MNKTKFLFLLCFNTLTLVASEITQVNTNKEQRQEINKTDKIYYFVAAATAISILSNILFMHINKRMLEQNYENRLNALGERLDQQNTEILGSVRQQGELTRNSTILTNMRDGIITIQAIIATHQQRD